MLMGFFPRYRSTLIFSRGKDRSNIHWLSAKAAVRAGKYVLKYLL